MSSGKSPAKWKNRPTKRKAHRAIYRELKPVVQSFLFADEGRVLTLPGDNPESVIEEKTHLLPDGEWDFVGVEDVNGVGEKETYYRLLQSDPVRSGEMEVKPVRLRDELRLQPQDRNLIHLGADFCDTWLSVPINAILSLFHGTFELEGGSMTITVKGSCPDISRGKTWRRGFDLAAQITEFGLSCLMVPLAYPTRYCKDHTPNSGHLMIRFGYAWFPSSDPSIVIGNPKLDFGVEQMHGGASLSKARGRWNKDRLQSYFRTRVPSPTELI